MRLLRAAVPVAQQMGRLLGSGALLLRCLPASRCHRCGRAAGGFDPGAALGSSAVRDGLPVGSGPGHRGRGVAHLDGTLATGGAPAGGPGPGADHPERSRRRPQHGTGPDPDPARRLSLDGLVAGARAVEFFKLSQRLPGLLDACGFGTLPPTRSPLAKAQLGQGNAATGRGHRVVVAASSSDPHAGPATAELGCEGGDEV